MIDYYMLWFVGCDCCDLGYCCLNVVFVVDWYVLIGYFFVFGVRWIWLVVGYLCWVGIFLYVNLVCMGMCIWVLVL